MIRKWTQSRLILGGFVLASLILAVTFQNCSASGDFSNSLVEPSGPVVDASNVDQIPFAFDYRPDQLAYMSCHRSFDQTANGSSKASTTHLNNSDIFFTLKIGSYRTGGLALRSEFIDYVKQTFTFKDILNDKEIEDAIQSGTENKNAALQFAIRPSTKLATLIYATSANTATNGASFQLFPTYTVLNANEFLPQMVSLFRHPTTRLNSLGSSALNPYPLEAAIHFEAEDSYHGVNAQGFRNMLQNGTANSGKRWLTVSYSRDLSVPDNANSAYFARSTNASLGANFIWGTGYQLSFTHGYQAHWPTANVAPTTTPLPIRSDNTLASVQEIDLTTNTPTNSTWTCPANYRYIIVSPKHRDTLSAPCSVPTSMTADQQAEYSMVANSLSESQWIIDPVHRCVSPKDVNFDCYGNTAGFDKPVDYNGTTAKCGYNSAATAAPYYYTSDCAEYVSICVRQ